MKWCCKISIMQFYRLFKKIIWKDIYVLQDDFINKALPFAKLSPWVCWWIWIFLSFLRKFHVKDFIPIGTLCRSTSIYSVKLLFMKCSFILIHQIFCGDKHDEKRVGTRLANCPKTSTFYPPLKQATATLWPVFWNIVQKSCEKQFNEKTLQLFIVL